MTNEEVGMCNRDLSEYLFNRLKEIGVDENNKYKKLYKEIVRLNIMVDLLKMEKAGIYRRCLEAEEAMYEAIHEGNDNHLVELVEEGVKIDMFESPGICRSSQF